MPEVREYFQDGLSSYHTVDEKERVYEKELIYAGDFFVKAEGASYEDFCANKPGSRIKLEVTPDAIRGWASTGNLMIEKGVQVNVPEGHTKKADKNHGKALRFRVGKHSKDPTKDALYGIIQFKDDKSAELAKTTNVSIYAEPEVPDSLGNKYTWPITHIALTDYPSIPALEPFRAIAASMFDGETKTEETPVSTPTVKPTPPVALKDETLDTLLKKYNITVPENATEDEKKKLLADYTEEVRALFGITIPAPSGDAKPAEKTAGTPAATVAASQVSIPKVQLSMIGEARKTKIERLAEQGKIAPTQIALLEKRYCTPEKVAIACSTEDGDDFDDQIKLLELNPALTPGGRTGQQRVALSNDMAGGEKKKSSLVEDAIRRKEKAEKAANRVM